MVVQSSKEEGASHFIPCPKQALQCNCQDLFSFQFFFVEKNQRPLDHSLGFHSCPIQTSFESPPPWSEETAMYIFWRGMAFGLWPLNVNGREVEFLVSCNLIDGNQWPLDLRPYCEPTLSLLSKNISHEFSPIWVSFWRSLKFQPLSWRVGSNPRRQSTNIYRNEIQNS